MPTLEATELAELRADVEATMGDLVAIGVSFPVRRGAEGKVAKFDYSAEIRAGFHELGPSQLARRGLDLTTTAAELRLPVDAWVSSRVRVKLLRRAGELVTPPQYYEVLGNATRGHSAAVLTLKQFEGDAISD